jgi:hypothetical protein
MAVKKGQSRAGARRLPTDLLAFGEQVWMAGLAAVSQQVSGTRRRAAQTRTALERALQLRVQQAMGQLGVPTADEIAALSRKVDRLNQSVVELTRRRTAARPRGARRPARRAR